MCMCGDYYCSLGAEASKWANAEHDRLIVSEEWIKRFSDPVQRDMALANHIWQEALRRFGTEEAPPSYPPVLCQASPNATTLKVSVTKSGGFWSWLKRLFFR